MGGQQRKYFDVLVFRWSGLGLTVVLSSVDPQNLAKKNFVNVMRAAKPNIPEKTYPTMSPADAELECNWKRRFKGVAL